MQSTLMQSIHILGSTGRIFPLIRVLGRFQFHHHFSGPENEVFLFLVHWWGRWVRTLQGPNFMQ